MYTLISFSKEDVTTTLTKPKLMRSLAHTNHPTSPEHPATPAQNEAPSSAARALLRGREVGMMSSLTPILPKEATSVDKPCC